MDVGYGYDRVDPFLLSRELELQCCWRDYFQNFEGANAMVVELLHWVVSCVILCIEPDFLSDLELWGLLAVSVIVLGHLICCMGQGLLPPLAFATFGLKGCQLP